MKLYFNKMHGCGNDFIMIENTAGMIDLNQEQIAHLCDRHLGIGADGLILVERRDGRFFMNYYNADGTKAQMCGNGLRCTVEFLRYFGFLEDTKTVMGTRAGLIEVDQIAPGFNRVHLAPADFSCASLPCIPENQEEEILEDTLTINGETLRYGVASVGNPHMVVMENPNELDIDQLGAVLEVHPMFPEKVNVNFAHVEDPSHVRIVTWERGSGRTLACGTGTSASCALLHKLGKIDDEVNVTLPGGELKIIVQDDGIYMFGPAEFVYRGEVDISES